MDISCSGFVLPSKIGYGFIVSIQKVFLNIFPVVRRQFRSPMNFPSQFTFGNGIIKVLSFCSKPKMFRVAARWIVTARTIVKHFQSIWDWSSKYNPRRSVGTNNIAFLISSATDLTIPICISAPTPRPASIRTTRSIQLNVEPCNKAFRESFRQCGVLIGIIKLVIGTWLNWSTEKWRQWCSVANLEVLRVDTNRIAARQPNPPCGRNSEVNQPRDFSGLNVSRGTSAFANNASCAVAINNSSPRPTPISFYNMPPEAVYDGVRASLVSEQRVGVKNGALKCAIEFSVRSVSLVLHSVSSVNCLPRLRLFVQRGATSFTVAKSSFLSTLFTIQTA